jgi:5-carboxymethyl-2-hydroxymuconate isomerase
MAIVAGEDQLVAGGVFDVPAIEPRQLRRSAYSVSSPQPCVANSALSLSVEAGKEGVDRSARNNRWESWVTPPAGTTGGGGAS